MDLAAIVEEKLTVPYKDGDEDKSGPRLGKRKAKFDDQVRKGVAAMEVRNYNRLDL
jgi:hypothetical protein